MHGRPTKAHIDLKALEHNYLEISRLLGPRTAMLAVVKANAYGHGSVEVTRTLEALGCAMFAVAIVEEGAQLREAGIKRPIAVLGGIFPDQAADVLEYGLTPVIFDLEAARAVDAAAKGRGTVAGIHVKIDTGMGRLGVAPKDAPGFFDALKALANVRVEAVLSHFAESESGQKAFSKAQLAAFLETVGEIRAGGTGGFLTEIANSAAIVDMEETRLNIARPGLMLYGAYPAPHLRDRIRLAPVMALKTGVLFLKELPTGATVSYNRRFTAKRPSVIATLPIGYADGVPRSLAGSGEVLIKGRRAPIAGTICMDLMMVDVTDIPGVRQGDEAVIIGSQGRETITAEEVASRASTISYEIFCSVSSRVPRVYSR